MKPVKIGILGLGTVGCGTINVLARNGQEIARRAGREIKIVQASARDLKKKRPCPTEGIRLVADPFEIVRNAEVEVVVELIGGYDPARSLVLEAIANGKHVITANKALIAVHGNEIFAAAQKRGVMVAFEAAVAGGIPIIKTMREGLTGNRIEWLAGIINGTSNFILTEMRDRGRDFAAVLAEAQRLGYAEADPAFDVDGIDAAHKLTILAAIAFGIPLQFKQAYIEGISRITRADVQYAEELGYRIKQLAIARRTDGGVELRVHPTLIPQRRIVANVDGVMNAVLVKGDAVGPVLLYGAGAGAEPTASAVVADLVDVVRTLTVDPTNRVPHLAFQPDALSDLPILPMERVETSYYLRLHALDRPGVLADITRILGDLGISIEAILQKEPAEGENVVPIIILTHRVVERNMNEAISRIEQLASIKGSVARIRLEHLNRDWK
ncbi:MAG: homoserine dehydrogenase [Candidatus Muproteobacteria bacterium RIFCSPHIGHO2_01_FULL_65_16]|uniref:Homoserine dehydrogenase n=1 Tax=Candidatus Muproteobacteria bacterium RIFCSPHIGHO2_01_FULL_65_16 TaxID=1817764 RepID=A0A1F6TI38_9PROT|nr:MAG: homoserine dehydrogenase [Candidatus Muproteobacteria bacterium RIFCSPHIGHO2_01_FULL_65_16]